MSGEIPDYPKHRAWIEREKAKMGEAGALKWEQVPDSPSTRSERDLTENAQSQSDQTEGS